MKKGISKKLLKKRDQGKDIEPKIYIIKCWNYNEAFLKVGLTTVAIEKRFAGRMPYKYKVVSLININEIGLLEYEQSIHSMMKEYKYFPKIKFSGRTECYTMEANGNILKLF